MWIQFYTVGSIDRQVSRYVVYFFVSNPFELISIQSQNRVTSVARSV